MQAGAMFPKIWSELAPWQNAGPLSDERSANTVSPIAILTMVSAAAAVAVVAMLQVEDQGRLSVYDARATVDQASGDVHIFFTLVNDGGDDVVTGFSSPDASAVALQGVLPDEQTRGAGLAMPAHSSLVFDTHLYLSARGVAIDPGAQAEDAILPLVLNFEKSDGIYVAVPIGEPAAAD